MEHCHNPLLGSRGCAIGVSLQSRIAYLAQSLMTIAACSIQIVSTHAHPLQPVPRMELLPQSNLPGRPAEAEAPHEPSETIGPPGGEAGRRDRGGAASTRENQRCRTEESTSSAVVLFRRRPAHRQATRSWPNHSDPPPPCPAGRRHGSGHRDERRSCEPAPHGTHATA